MRPRPPSPDRISRGISAVSDRGPGDGWDRGPVASARAAAGRARSGAPGTRLARARRAAAATGGSAGVCIGDVRTILHKRSRGNPGPARSARARRRSANRRSSSFSRLPRARQCFLPLSAQPAAGAPRREPHDSARRACCPGRPHGQRQEHAVRHSDGAARTVSRPASDRRATGRGRGLAGEHRACAAEHLSGRHVDRGEHRPGDSGCRA